MVGPVFGWVVALLKVLVSNSVLLVLWSFSTVLESVALELAVALGSALEAMHHQALAYPHNYRRNNMRFHSTASPSKSYLAQLPPGLYMTRY